ncbi:MAG: AMP phosphorylase [Candidatus Woesearchaeota archaeon]
MKKFTTKKIAITTGSILICMLHQKDAALLHVKPGDRVVVQSGRAKITCIVDFGTLVKPGEVGLFEDVLKKFPAKNTVTVSILPKPRAVFAIAKKLRGEILSAKEMQEIVRAISHNELTDVELTYFVSACYVHELTKNEIVWLTQAMIDRGDRLSYNTKKPILDKHCIGGVPGNRTTAVVVPIIAAAGYYIPKTSSRSITSPAGTSDTIEVLANVSLSAKDIQKTVKKVGGCLVWGGALDLAPADDKIIKVEHPMSLDPTGQLIASILAKKKSVGSTHVLIDIPVGKHAKIESMKKAKLLQELFVVIGKKLGMRVNAIITDGSQPIGRGIGPALEARDILLTLKNDPAGSSYLKKKAITLAGDLLDMVQKKRDGKTWAQELFDSGKAYDKFIEIMQAQGAVINPLTPENVPMAKHKKLLRASKSGYIQHINNKEISRIAVLLGAPSDITAGLYLHVRAKTKVKKGDVLYELYSSSKTKLQNAFTYATQSSAYTITRK